MHGLEPLYRCLAPLGQGAEGEVYLVEDLYRDGMLVALKILLDGQSSPPAELQHLARLRHPGIARVLDAGVLPGRAGRYFTTEYVTGSPITTIPAPLSWDLLTELLVQACEAIRALNEVGYRHGDLKPAHLLYDGEDSPRLCLIDLGHAAPLDRVPVERVGTAPYAAPEMWTGNDIPGRSCDLYALGMITLETIVGALPLRGADSRAWRDWHESGDREQALASAAVPPPDRIREVILSCLQPDPADRPRDAESLLQRLRPGDQRAAGLRSSDSHTPMVGRHALLEELLSGARSSATGRVVLLSGGPGSGKTRVLETLERRARGEGIAVDRLDAASIGAGDGIGARLARTLGGHAPSRLLLIDGLRSRLQLGATPLSLGLGSWSRELGQTFHTVIALDPEQLAPDLAADEFEAARLPVGVRVLDPLDRESVAELMEAIQPGSLDDPAAIDALWQKSRGIPGVVMAELGDDASPQESAPLPRGAADLLSSMPAPVPVEVFMETLSWSARMLWTAVGGGALQVVGSAPDLRVLPREPGQARRPSATRLKALARRWRDSDDAAAEWAPTILEHAAGGNSDSPEIAAIRLRLREQRNWGALERLARLLPRPQGEIDWDLLAAWAHTGRNPDALHIIEDSRIEPGDLDAGAASLVGEIWQKAGRPEQALPFFRRAAATEEDPGRRLESVADELRTSLALGLRDDARELVATLKSTGILDPDRLASIHAAAAQKLAGLLQQLGEYSVAADLYRHALATARQQGPTGAAVIVASLSGLAGEARRQGKLDEAERLLRLGIRYASTVGLGANALLLEANLAGVLFHGNRPDEALACYRRLLHAVRLQNDQRLLPHVGLGIGTIYRERGELVRAWAALSRAARDARAARNQAALANILANVGELYLLLGDPDQAFRTRKEVLRIARQIGNHSLICQARAGLGAALTRQGRPDEARSLLDRALAMEQGDMGLRVNAMIQAFVGEVDWQEGEIDAALRAWARATRDGLRSRRFDYACRGIAGMARIVETRGDLARARALLARADGIARRAPTPAVTRAWLEWRRIGLEYREKGGAPAVLEAWRNLLSTAERLSIREIVAGCVIGLHHHGQPVPDGAHSRVAALLRRLAEGSQRALAARLEIEAELAAYLSSSRPATAVPTTLVHREPPETTAWLGALDALRQSWHATSLDVIVASPDWRKLAHVADGEREHLEPAPETVPPAPNLDREELEATRREGRLLLPLQTAGLCECALLVLELPSDAPRGPDRVELAVIEEGLWYHLWSRLRARREADIARLRADLDHTREEGAQERERMETEILTQKLELRRLDAAIREMESENPPWVALSPAMRQIESRLEAWAESDLPVLISGESGTGKDVIARRLHAFSPRRERPFVLENCSAVPEGLLEVELFGYHEGAFTGADQDREGLLDRAHEGTLILDHLDELPPPLQAKLLTVLETGTFRPLGASEPRQVDVRLIVTCRRPPRELIAEERLRADLYYRLQGVEIMIPPLRERTEEIAALLHSQLEWFGERLALPVPAVDPEVVEALVEHDWPGNVRELSNLVQRWLILRPGRIGPDLLPAAPAPPPTAAEWPEPGTPWREAMARLQRQYLLSCLEECEGNQRELAATLGLSRRHLQNLLEKLDLRRKAAN